MHRLGMIAKQAHDDVETALNETGKLLHNPHDLTADRARQLGQRARQEVARRIDAFLVSSPSAVATFSTASVAVGRVSWPMAVKVSSKFSTLSVASLLNGVPLLSASASRLAASAVTPDLSPVEAMTAASWA